MTRLLIGALLFALSLPVIVSAQVTTSGRLTGLVTDTQGALVPGATIEAIQNETKTSFTAIANGEGGWSIPSLPNGTYTVSVTAPNFKKTVIQNVKVDAGQIATANATLEPGGANEEVVVSGGSPVRCSIRWPARSATSPTSVEPCATPRPVASATTAAGQRSVISRATRAARVT